MDAAGGLGPVSGMDAAGGLGPFTCVNAAGDLGPATLAAAGGFRLPFIRSSLVAACGAIPA
jgi:hypothetical protein